MNAVEGGVTLTTSELLRRSQEIYDQRLEQNPERIHLHALVAIEPDSGDFFLGSSLSEAAAHPDRPTCVLGVGHDTTTIGTGLS